MSLLLTALNLLLLHFFFSLSFPKVLFEKGVCKKKRYYTNSILYCFIYRLLEELVV